MRRPVLAGGCLLTLLLIYLFCPFQLGIVCGESMEPTFHSGQAILIDRHYYRRQPVTRGDVVLLHREGEILIKRVFALAGDAFHVLVMPDETGISRFVVTPDEAQRLQRARRCYRGMRVTRMRVPDGHIYVLGDNTGASVDSRDFGMVPLKHIIGRVADGEGGARMRQTAALIMPSVPSLPARAHIAADDPGARLTGATTAAASSRGTPAAQPARY